MADKLWGGRFQEATDALVDRINASVSFDKALYREDLTGSIAHLRMLEKVGLVTSAQAAAIEQGLRDIRVQIEAGNFEWRQDREDVHLNIEAALTESVGPDAGRLHTARSRNDQVALDLALYLREALLDRGQDLLALVGALLDKAQGQESVVLPGYTHLQRAQPVSLAHHLHAYAVMLMRDVERFVDAYARVDRLPLGSGALAGTPHPIDREHVAESLGFAAVSENSLDAVSDRDGAVEFMSAAALCMSHLSRLGEELVLWMSQEFRYVTLSDAFCTGSSIMPQKKNPDVAELVRGKAGRVTGDLVSLLMTLKGLPLAYNKDMQEDKEPLFDANQTVGDCLQVLAAVIADAQFNAEQMSAGLRAGFVMATDLADALVAAGVPFRDAHHRIGALVGECSDRKIDLEELTDAEYQTALPELSAEIVRLALDPVHSLSRRDQTGGPAPSQVLSAQSAHQQKAADLGQRIDALRAHTELIDWMRNAQ